MEGVLAIETDGAPSDCVALAALGLISDKFDLVASGINPHANLGHDVTYSGTVTAAMEGAICGVPSLAVSLNSNQAPTSPADYAPAARAARRVAVQILEHGLPPHTLLNMNVPYLPEGEIQGVSITRMGLRIYRDQLVTRYDPRERPYYWIGGEPPTGVPDEGTDFWALSRDYISITPIQLDMTAYPAVDALAHWNFDNFKHG
jgi:5'-nucleotidase